MSGTDVIGALFFAHAPLLAVVPKGKIKVEEVPQDVVPPFIVLESSGSQDHKPLKQGSRRHCKERVTATVCASSVAQRDQILKLMRAAGSDFIGDIAGVTDVVVKLGAKHSPIKISPADLYTRGQDFMVSFNEAA